MKGLYVEVEYYELINLLPRQLKGKVRNKRALARALKEGLIAYENEKGSSNSFNKVINSINPNQSVAIIIGPEGGFSEKEVEEASKLGYTSVSLGKRILRAETATFYALSVIANRLEDK